MFAGDLAEIGDAEAAGGEVGASAGEDGLERQRPPKGALAPARDDVSERAGELGLLVGLEGEEGWAPAFALVRGSCALGDGTPTREEVIAGALGLELTEEGEGGAVVEQEGAEVEGVGLGVARGLVGGAAKGAWVGSSGAMGRSGGLQEGDRGGPVLLLGVRGGDGEGEDGEDVVEGG